MSTTRATLIQRAARRIGGRTGTIASGTATTAVLNGLINTTGDDGTFKADRLMLLEAATEADKERLITAWTDLTGTATFATRADTIYTGETYILSKREDYSLAEYRSALSKALTYTRRSYRYVLPITPNLTLAPLLGMDWLEGAGDIDAVFLNESPIWLHNEDFALWQNGSALAPDGWTLAGSGAAVARTTTGFRSAYGVTVTRATNNATLYQSIPPQLVQWLTRRQAVNFIPIQAWAWGTSSTANIGRVGIYNGSTTTWSSYHTGNGVPQCLTVSYTPTATDTDFRVVLSTDTTDGAVTWNAAGLMQANSLPYSAKDQGSQGYLEREIQFAPRNMGGIPAIEIPYATPGFGQLAIYSRRPFADMTLDTDTCEDEFARVLEAGLLRWLLDANKPDQDRARLDRVMKEEAALWVRFLQNATDKPVQRPLQQAQIVGA